MRWDVLVRGGTIVAPDGVRVADIAVIDGVIAAIEPEIAGAATEEIDAAQLHVLPGLIDAHVHFNEPGRTEWEGFATGSAALAAGGGVCFFDMPLNASPPTLDAASFDAKRAAAEASSVTDFALWGGLTPANLDRMDELAARGVVGFKAFMCHSGIYDFPHADDATLHRGMAIAARLGLPVAVHAESEQMVSRLAAVASAAGRHGVRDYLASRPIAAEVDAIRRAVAMAADTGCSLHIVHVSSAAGCMAASGHANVTFETCPHYLALTMEDAEQLGATAKCAPPLRDAQEVEALWRQVESGDVALIASDHSPSPASMKQGDDYFAVWGGIAGVQSTLAVLLSGRPPLPIERVARLTAANVADRFGLIGKGHVAVGCDADLILVDLDEGYVLTRDMLEDRHRLSPYVGRAFQGCVRRTIVRGRTVYADGRVHRDVRGRLVTPRAREAMRA
jgi:allantoinase